MVKQRDTSKAAGADLLVRFSAGDVIYTQNEPGAEMYIVEEGQVELVNSASTEERLAAVLEVGDFFGERSVLEDVPRRHTARALTDCSLLPIDVWTFDTMLREHPEVILRMMRMLSARLLEYEEAYEGAGPEPVLAEDAGAAPGADRAAEPPEGETTALAWLVETASNVSFPIGLEGKSSIGRSDPATGTHADVDLSSLDRNRSLSRRHASIWFEKGQFFVREELGAANGTFVKSRKLEAGESCEIAPGETLRLGLVELRLKLEPDAR